jgi:nitric oxide reductase subunit B
MLLFASVFYILNQQKPALFINKRRWIAVGSIITNIALIFFWTALIGSGLVKISGKVNNEAFAVMMKKCEPFFKIFTGSGVIIWIGLAILIIAAYAIIFNKEKNAITLKRSENKIIELESLES